MSIISFDRVSRSWGAFQAVKELSFSVEKGEFLVLLGPSGCGKSTTLRLIAGLEEATGGTIEISGKDVTTAPPKDRGLSMVFQSYALFPHLSVAENIQFGLKVRKVPTKEREEKLRWAADLVGLSDYLDRKPSQLSGGQRQRVALARAVVADNPICLMDEPLSNLDAALRHSMRREIRDLQQRLGLTLVYVTHDQVEAMAMADRVILLRDGRIEQQGRPEELYQAPSSNFVARFIGLPPMNLMPDLFTNQSDLLVGVRPEHISLAGNEEQGCSAVIESAEYHGADSVVTARIGDHSVQVKMAGRQLPGTHLPNVGESVSLCWRQEDQHLFSRDSGQRLELQQPCPWET
ncbi:ABC transporter ATP-binding protein [Rhodovibrionaceae bacterium A322]